MRRAGPGIGLAHNVCHHKLPFLQGGQSLIPGWQNMRASLQHAACLRGTGSIDAQCETLPQRLRSRPLKHARAVQEHAYDHEAVEWLIENCPTLVQMFEGMCKVYADRTMFGFCSPGSDEWQTMTYRQFHERVVQFAAGVPAACLA